MSIVEKVNDQMLKRIKSEYNGYDTFAPSEHMSHYYKTNGCTISIYNSKKVMWQGSNAKKEHAKFFKAEPKQEQSLPMIGSDEVGVGDYFGPLVVASARVTEQDIEWMKDLNIRDTKKMKDEEIIKVANKLETKLAYVVEMFNNTQYNNLTSDGHNAHVLKSILHNKVHAKLATKYPNEFHVVDQYVSEKNYYNYFTKLGIKPLTGMHFETKAEDKYIAVACAAIIARKHFLQAIDKLSSELKVKLPLGAGSIVDKTIIELRKSHGEEVLKKYGKYSFANTTKTKKA